MQTTNDVAQLPTIIASATKVNSNLSIDKYLGKRSASEVDYELEQTFVGLPGTSTRIILEFPQYNIDGRTAILDLEDTMTLSISTLRAKPPTTVLGQTMVTGFGLGQRMVAGSMIRNVFTTDKLTELQSKIFLEDQENIAARLAGLDGKMPSGLPLKESSGILLDDLTTFNIHCYSAPETVARHIETDYAPRERFETIVGCVITNMGQVYSIEDLITENTISFQAKGLRSSTNIEDYTRGFGGTAAYPAGSTLLKNKRKTKDKGIINLQGFY